MIHSTVPKPKVIYKRPVQSQRIIDWDNYPKFLKNENEVNLFNLAITKKFPLSQGVSMESIRFFLKENNVPLRIPIFFAPFLF